jgi:chromosome segregation ATPase
MPDLGDQQDLRPRPDPTLLTTEQLLREVMHSQRLLEQELATVEARLAGYEALATERARKIEQTRAEDKRSLDAHNTHLDKVRTEDKEEARALVNLALAGQKEMTSNALTAANLAIDKAAESTTKRYETLSGTVESLRAIMAMMMPRSESEARHAAAASALAALSTRVTTVEAAKAGGKETLYGVYALAAFLVSLLIIGGILAAAGVFTHHS